MLSSTSPSLLPRCFFLVSPSPLLPTHLAEIAERVTMHEEIMDRMEREGLLDLRIGREANVKEGDDERQEVEPDGGFAATTQDRGDPSGWR